MSTAVSPDEFARAMQERRRRDRRRTVTGLVVGSVVLLLCGAALYLLYFSPVLAVRDVAVLGNRVLTVDEVRSAAAVAPERPLAAVDTDRVAARVEELPAVESARASRRFPGTVVVEVTERTLVYQLRRGSQFEWVDRSGTVFRTTDRAEPGIVVAVVDPAADERLLRDLADVAGHLPPDLRGSVSEIRAAGMDRISLKLDGGATVVWGSADESELKAKVLATLVAKVKAKVYDVSAPAYPTTR